MATPSKTQDGHFTILYFASASSYTSKDSESFQAPVPLSKLFDSLEDKYKGIKAKILESCLVTINLEYVDVPENVSTDGRETVIKDGDEVAIIPPVSSG
jgi:molybdopterin synthase sulfur carrier subunit